jgi:hypothetical protein
MTNTHTPIHPDVVRYIEVLNEQRRIFAATEDITVRQNALHTVLAAYAAALVAAGDARSYSADPAPDGDITIRMRKGWTDIVHIRAQRGCCFIDIERTGGNARKASIPAIGAGAYAAVRLATYSLLNEAERARSGGESGPASA